MGPEKPLEELPKTREEMQQKMNQMFEDQVNKVAKEKGIHPILIKIHLFDLLFGNKPKP